MVRYTTFDLASPRRAQKKHIAPTDDPAAAWAAALALAPLGWAVWAVVAAPAREGANAGDEIHNF